jgi:hypothetical protein
MDEVSPFVLTSHVPSYPATHAESLFVHRCVPLGQWRVVAGSGCSSPLVRAVTLRGPANY